MSTSSKGWLGAGLVALAIITPLSLGLGVQSTEASDTTDQCIEDLIETADAVIQGGSDALNLASLGLKNSNNITMLQSLNNEMQQNLPQFRLDVQEYQATKARCAGVE